MGNNKTANRFDTNDGQITVGMKVTKVFMGFQANFASVQFILSDGVTEHALPHVGTIPMNKQYVVPADDELKCIRFGVRHATNLTNHLRFATVQFTTKGGA
jgi:hypothetical protein